MSTNIWDVLSMFAFIPLIYFVKDAQLALTIAIVLIIGIIHHIYIKNRALLIIDTGVQICLCITLLILLKKHVALWMVFTVALTFVIAIVWFKVNAYTMTVFVGIAYTIVFFTNVNKYTAPTWFWGLIILALIGLCAVHQPCWIYVWPMVHVIGPVAIYFAFRDLGLV
jgi:hypothetical protein